METRMGGNKGKQKPTIFGVLAIMGNRKLVTVRVDAIEVLLGLMPAHGLFGLHVLQGGLCLLIVHLCRGLAHQPCGTPPTPHRGI